MEIDAVLEAFKDFEKKGKKDTCPLLEQFLCHVAKTGEAVIPWSQFKPYFLFKLEKVMDDFHAAMPEQRGPTNPNVEYIPFDEMKKRILKIVDGYNGIPFTIQRLCELLTEPKRNYSGAEKFLRGVEKNVMVVSCVYPTSGKNGATSVNRMNGVMFPGNSSVYSDSRNINGPGTPRAFHRPKLALTTSLSTNGLPDCTVSREPEASTEQMEEQHDGDSSLSKRESRQCSGMKNKLEEEDEDSEAVEHDVKRLKFGDNEEESEEKGTTCPAESESAEETPDSSKDAEEEEKIDTSVEEPVISEDHEPRSAEPEPSEMDEQSPEADPVASPTHREASDSTTDQPEQAVQPGEGLSSESQDNGESADRVSSSSSGSNDSDAEDTPTDTPGDTSVPTTPTSTPEQSAEDATDENSDSTLTANEPGEPE